MANKVPTQQAIDHLLANPGTDAQFDEFFGAGAAAAILNPQPEAPIVPPTEPVEAASLPETEPDGGGQSLATEDQIVRGAEHGGRNFVNSVVDLVGSGSDLVSEGLNEIGIPTVFTDDGRVITREEAEAEGVEVAGADVLSVENVDAPVTVEGQLTSGLTQFATGYALTGGVMSAAGIGGSLTAAGAGFTKGAVADFVSFSGDEGRLADLVQSVPELDNAITRYLATDEDDTILEARLKNVLEGGALGIVAELAVKAIKSSARYVRGGNTGAENLDELAAAAKEDNEALERALLTPEETRAKVAVQQGDDLGIGVDTAEDVVRQSDEAKTVDAPALDEETKLRIVADIADPHSSSEEFAAHFNPNKYTEGVQEEMNALVDIASRQFADQWSGTETQRLVVQQAARAMEMPKEAIEFLMRQADSAQDMSKAVIMAKMYQASTAIHLGPVTDRFLVAIQQGDTVGLAAADEALDNILRLAWQANDVAKKIGQGSGRALSIHNVAQNAEFSKHLLDEVMNLKGSAKLAAVRRLNQMAKADPSGGVAARGINKLVRKGSRMIDMHNEFWINSILSSPRTHIVNIASNAIETGLLPAEEALGAILRNPFSKKQWEIASEAMDTYSGLVHMAGDSFRKSKLAFLENRNILDPEQTIRDDGAVRSIPGVTGKVIGVPTRLLQAEDEFFKQINFRARLMRDGLKKARDTGITTKKQQVEFAERFVDDQVDNITGHAKVTGDDATFEAQRALAYAEESTFTTALQQGTLGHGIQSLVAAQPYLRPIVPFIRTPTNLIRHMIKRFPGTTFLYRHEREALMGVHGSLEQSRAIGKFATGTAFTGLGLLLASNGLITGSGPSDPRQNAIWRETNQPWSVNIDGTWIDIRRLDPRLAVFGFIGEAAEVGKWGGGEDDTTSLFGAITMSVVRQMQDRSYFQGVSDLMEAISQQNGSGSMERWLYQRAGSYVPYSGLLKTINPDQEMKDVRSLLDGIKATVPMLSGTVEPKRSPLTGKPLERSNDLLGQYTPFRVMEETDEGIGSLLIEFEVGMESVRDKRPGTRIEYSSYVDPETGQTALDFMREQIGEPATDGGRTLVEALEVLTQGDAFQEAVEQWRTNGAPGVTPRPKIMIQQVIDFYRELAFEKAKLAFPDLARDIAAERVNNKNGLELFGLSLQ